MEHEFDAAYWAEHWLRAGEGDDVRLVPAHPYVETELGELHPGTALDAGCGEGAEAIELASRGWRVTGADISAEALTRARARAEGAGAEVSWLEVDLARWEPDEPFDLVTTFYAHPDIPQLDFYARIAEWVAPRGTLLIVGHLHEADGGAHGGGPALGGGPAHADERGRGRTSEQGHRHTSEHERGPAQPQAEAEVPAFPVAATVRAADVAALLAPDRWQVVTAEEREREVPGREGRPRLLRDVVVRATRR